MKKFLLTFCLATGLSYSQDTIIDIDGNTYDFLSYGTQDWTVENAAMGTYRDGTTIPQVTEATEWNNLTTGAWCYYNNDPNKGKLYNWYAVMGIHDNDPSTPNKEFAPEGWHVPSDEEWTTLEEYLIANGYNYDGTTTGNKIAKSMASNDEWSFGGIGSPGENESTNNSSGFNAKPEQWREGIFSGNYQEGFYNGGGNALFWTQTDAETNLAFQRGILHYEVSLLSPPVSKLGGKSVRFVQDSENNCSADGTFQDQDGNAHQYINYGSLDWSVSEVNVTTYRDGTPIPLVVDESDWGSQSTGAYCYVNNDPNNNILYNYYAIIGKHDNDPNTPNKNLAPEGWRMPSEADWNNLDEFISNSDYVSDGNVAMTMASTSGWNNSSNQGAPGFMQSENNSSCFNAYPNGTRGVGAGFNQQGETSEFWSTDEQTHYINFAINTFINTNNNPGNGKSARFVRDFEDNCTSDITITASASEVCAGESVDLSVNLNLPTICDMQINLTDIPLGQEIPGFTYGGFYNEHYYYVHNDPTSWTDGEQICRENGGYLVCINDESENTFVSNLTNNNIWIGLLRDPETCEFRWLDCIDINYTNWRPGEPNSGPCGEPYTQIIRGCSFGYNTWNNLGNNSSNGACYSNMVPIMEIDPEIYQTFDPSTTYLWSTGDTTETISVTPTETTEYWVDVITNGMTCREYVTINVTAPVAPTGDSEQTFCGTATVADLTVMGDSIQWYDAATGGNLLDSTTILTDGQVVYASSFISYLDFNNWNNESNGGNGNEPSDDPNGNFENYALIKTPSGLWDDYQENTQAKHLLESNVSLGIVSGYDYLGNNNSSYYYKSQNSSSWNEANNTANLSGGWLATIKSQAESDFVTELVSEFSSDLVWIGLYQDIEDNNYSEPDGAWKWLNFYQCEESRLAVTVSIQDITITASATEVCAGESVDLSISTIDVEYFNWDDNEPNDTAGIENVVHIQPSGKWNDNGSESYSTNAIFELNYEVSELGNLIFLGHYNNHSYFYANQSLSWPDANQMAESYNTYLLNINTAEENEFIVNSVNNLGLVLDAWLGMIQDENDELYSEPSGGWKWLNSNYLNPEDYSYIWSTGDTAENITVTPTETTEYWVDVTTNGVTCREYITISVQEITINASATEVCAGESVDLTISSGLTAGSAVCTSSDLPTNLQNGLVGYWPFCGNANDESGNGNNGTVNGAILTSDRFGEDDNAYLFDGINDWVSLNGPIQDMANFTISAWVYHTGESYSGIFSDANGVPGEDVFFNMSPSEVGVHADKQSTNLKSLVIPGPLSGPSAFVTSQDFNGQWQNILWTLSPTESKIYINGINVAIIDATGSNIGNHDSNPSIGRLTDNFTSEFYPTQYFTGKLDDFIIWSRTLSESEIQQLTNFSTYTWSTGETTTNIIVTPTETTEYWVDVTTNGVTCREYITISVTAPPAPTGNSVQGGCSDSTVGSNNNAFTGENLQWYAAPSGGTALPDSHLLADGTYYYISQTVNGCESSDRFEFLYLAPQPTITIDNSVICEGDIAIVSVSSSPSLGSATFLWNTGETSESITLSPTESSTFWVDQIYNSGGPENIQTVCRYFFEITVDNAPEAPISGGDILECETIAAQSLFATASANAGESITWYDAATGGNVVANPSLGTAGTVTFFAEAINDTSGCSSLTRTAVTLTITSVAAPTGDAVQSFCDNVTVSDLLVTGSNIQWYDAATGGNGLDPSSALANEQVLYASQTQNGCESLNRLEVNVEIDIIPDPILINTELEFCLAREETLADLEIDDQGFALELYDSFSGGNMLPMDTLLEDGVSYYATLYDAVSGCESLVRLEVVPTVIPCEVIIYNALSLNGNGQNDYMVIENAEYFPDNSLEVYNRDGHLIYSQTQYGLDDNLFRGVANVGNIYGGGTIYNSSSGSNLPTGSYLYVFKYFNPYEQQQYTLKGFLTINSN